MNEISRFTPFPLQPDADAREMPLYVFGHKNPDSDSICSALVVADWLNHLGKPAVAFRLGELTPETRYILAAAGVQAPPLLKGDLRDRKVWLVDFTDVEQGPASLPDSDVVGVIDHHRLGTLVTRNPPDVWVRTVGCCATVILQILAAERPMPLSSAQATLLLGAILSDTVALSAPIATEQERLAVSRLRAIAHVDYDAFTAGLLAAKTDLSGQSAAQFLHRDAKNYRIQSVSLLLSQIEVRTMSDIDPLLPALQQALEHAKQEAGLEMAALLVTDITCRRSTLYFSPNWVLDIRQVSLPGMTSRKKEVLPWLTRQIANAGR
ncbi:Manganese-dependent inorganic pyrophosphatase [Serratia marcescens]|uniref:DHHA2 domain-containing protein n=1 Tax=Serratia marcescens TaxID=615 RepID=UPI00217A5AC3|nr:DHHA2 domain-containing protein [Serratia marcescens]CAI0773935.1 Manganese-dependent inorganic pyrophosphatase [Serratia marcescens]CAI0850946.1 Manganese-dependent inorganic pyrophosphatase [Serratia marcescens]CAI1658749.1 Manganese-dependent inorganic pyrophosphatase [Serratia marcescens]CAI1723138.1 Manganese-dependent inorganic pyrophosphatase [Serratia marcescens]